MMIVEIVVIADEVLSGRTLDTNSYYLTRKLFEIGLYLRRINVVSDNLEQQISALKEIIKRSDIVITTGGLGPTPDDRLREALSSALDIPLEENTDACSMLMNYRFKNQMGYTKQVMLPEGSTALKNSVGVAPGIYIHTEKDKHIFCLPGVPKEMKQMFSDEVVKILNKITPVHKTRSYTLRTTGICEIEMLKVIQKNKIPEDNIAFYPSVEGVDLIVSNNEQTYKKLEKIFAQFIYTKDNKDLNEIVGELLRDKSMTLSCAESCSGGALSSRIVDIPGSSSYFIGGIVSYSNNAKIELLGVDKKILDEMGAVSEEIAIQMAVGCNNRLQTDYALSTTGIAGPTGGSRDKPIGTVYIALAKRDKPTFVQHFHFKGTRDDVRRKTVQNALFMLYRRLRKDN